MSSNDDEVILSSSRHQKRRRSQGSSSLFYYPQRPPSTSLDDNRPEVLSKEGAEKSNGSKAVDGGRIEPTPRLERLSGHASHGNGTDNVDTLAQSPGSGFGRTAHWFVNMKCTDSALASFSFFIGVAAILLQVMSLGSDHWLYTMEPRPVGNLTENNGEPKEFLFQYNSGYWRTCRERFSQPDDNLTTLELYFFTVEPEYQRVCLSWNRPPNGSDDHLGFGKASGAILNRILLSAALHIASLGITGLALALAVPGHIRRDKRTFIAAILYILSGICMSIAVMQYICVVDDEMAPKMKQTPEGESSKYKFDYGWSYVAASMSFMCIETCALVELLLFLRRFPSLEDKMAIVPGLKDKIRRAVLHHEFDEILPARTCSRSSPRISFSYTPPDDTDAIETAFSDSV